MLFWWSWSGSCEVGDGCVSATTVHHANGTHGKPGIRTCLSNMFDLII